MKVFQHSSLNNMLYLFEHKLHDPWFEQELFQCLLTCDAEDLVQNSPNYGNLLSTLCHLPKIYRQTGFEKALIFLMNKMVLRLNALNKPMLNIDLLLNGSHPVTIFMLLLKIKQFEAAENCLYHLKILAEKRIIINRIVDAQLFQKSEFGQWHLTNLAKKCNGDEFRLLSTVLFKSYLYFAFPRKQLIDWLVSLVNLQELDLYALLLSVNVTLLEKQRFFDNLVLFCDFNIIHRHELVVLLHTAKYRISLLDFTLTQPCFSLGFFNALLRFYETLFRHHHLSQSHFLELIIAHPRPGFSIMHQLIYQGHYAGLSNYLDYLEHLLAQQLISNDAINSAYLSTNTKGFNCFYQAINSFHPGIPALFLQHLMQRFSKTEVLELITKGSYNPIYERYFRPRCANDKKHAAPTNRMISELKQRLKDELQRTVAPQSSVAQSNCFFMQNKATANYDRVCQRLSAPGVSL